MLKNFNIQSNPIRYEFGIRIETSLDHEVFLHENNKKYCNTKDVKLIHNDPDSNIEFRTFCTCRGGEIAACEYDQFTAISGRSEPNSNKTNYANFGLLMKFKGKSYL